MRVTNHPNQKSIGLLLASVVTLASAAAQDKPDPVVATKNAIQQWVTTNRLLQQEKKKWAVDKQLLRDRIEMVKAQIDDLRAKVGDADKSIAAAASQSRKLQEQTTKLRASMQFLEKAITPLEARVKQLMAQSPDLLREMSQIKALLQLLPDENKAKEVPLGDRFRNVLGILNVVNKFNREIKISREPRQLQNGNHAEVITMYVGLGRAFWVTIKGDTAGYGTATKSGWQWYEDNTQAAAIAKVVQVYKNELPAAYVSLPIQLD